MTKDLKIIGFTDKVNECDCCGKQNLKGTYCVTIDGNEFYYGSSCATNKGANKVELKENLSNFKQIEKWVNSVIRRNKINRSELENMMEWALLNKGKSFNEYFILK